jgi:calcineurin-like phosphoesterase
MGWYLDGRVTAVVGTHTHVATADDQIFPRGTAYISDVGMTGPHDGIIGMDRAGIVQKFLDGLPRRFEVAAGNIQMNCVLIVVDDDAALTAGSDAALTAGSDGSRVRARSISRLRLKLD